MILECLLHSRTVHRCAKTRSIIRWRFTRDRLHNRSNILPWRLARTRSEYLCCICLSPSVPVVNIGWSLFHPCVNLVVPLTNSRFKYSWGNVMILVEELGISDIYLPLLEFPFLPERKLRSTFFLSLVQKQSLSQRSSRSCIIWNWNLTVNLMLPFR